MPQQNPFQAAISGLIGGRKPLGSIQTPSMGEGQFYEDPSVTAHGLLKSQEDEIQNRMYNETDPAGLERLKRFLTGTQTDITDNEASMRNPAMEANYDANLKAQRLGFPDSAAEGAYGRSQEEAKMHIPIESAEIAGQYDVNQERERGKYLLDLQREGNRDFGNREDKFYSELEEAQNRASGVDGVSQFLTGITPPGPKSSGRFSFSAPQRPQSTATEAKYIADELARLQNDMSRDPGSINALASAATSLMGKLGIDSEAQSIIVDILVNPKPGDNLKSSDQIYESSDPEDKRIVRDLLRQFRGR